MTPYDHIMIPCAVVALLALFAGYAITTWYDRRLRDWKTYWNRPLPSANPLVQVDQTKHGRPIDDNQVCLIRESILSALGPRPDDHLLDLCCGNGHMTRQLAPYFESVLAVDYSYRLYGEAQRSTPDGSNVLFFCADVRKPYRITPRQYSRACIYAGLQYFNEADFRHVLLMTTPLLTDDAVLFLGAVPDRKMRWRFYNTPLRWASWFWRTIHGREAIGHWWSKRELKRTLEDFGFSVEFRPQPKGLYTAHYRFDVVARRDQ